MGPINLKQMKTLWGHPYLYDYIDRWDFAEDGSAKYCHGAGQALNITAHARFKWTSLTEDVFQLELDDVTLRNPYSEEEIVGSIPPQSTKVRIENGPYAFRQQVIWEVKDQADWPCLIYPWRLVFDRHPLSVPEMSKTGEGNLHHLLEGSPLPGGSCRYYPDVCQEDIHSKDVVKRGITRRSLLIVHDTGPVESSSAISESEPEPAEPTKSEAEKDDSGERSNGLRGLWRRVKEKLHIGSEPEEFDGGKPDDGPGFGFALDNPGSSIVSPVRRRLDGDIWCVAMGLRGHTENGIDKAVEYLSEVGMDEVFLLSLFPLLSNTQQRLLATTVNEIEKQAPDTPVHILQLHDCADLVAHELAQLARLFAFKDDSDGDLHLLCCCEVSVCGSDGHVNTHESYPKDAQALASAIAEQLDLPANRWSLAFVGERDEACDTTPSIDNEVLKMAQSGIKKVRTIWLSPLVPGQDALNVLEQAEKNFSDAGGQEIYTIPPLLTGAIPEILARGVSALLQSRTSDDGGQESPATTQ